MSQRIFKQVWQAVSTLNPADVRALAARSITIRLHAEDDAVLDAMQNFLCPDSLSRERRLQILNHLFAARDGDAPAEVDLEICEEGMEAPGAYAFELDRPDAVVTAILQTRDDLSLPLARRFPPFRRPVIRGVIHTIAKENALFSLATAFPDIVPSLVSLPWAVGEFASDTAVLSVNQIRMAFLIAAASDREASYKDQSAEIGSILAGAFGWRALAREAVGKIPFGGGLIPKAAIAYAGTLLVGNALERLYRDGYRLSRRERRDFYEDALEKGKRVAKDLLSAVKPKEPTAST